MLSQRQLVILSWILLAVLFVAVFLSLSPFGEKWGLSWATLFGGKPTGAIYLSLRPNPPHANPISIYEYSLDTNKLINIAEDNGSYLTGRISPDKSDFAYIAFLDETKKYELFVTDSNDSSKRRLLSSTRETLIKRSPVWSPDGTKIVFQAKTDSYGGDPDPSKWFVYIADVLTGKDRFLTDGVNPLFIPDGRLLVLKNDGLYVIDPSSGVGEKIWKVEGGDASANMKLDVSRDGKFIAWSVPYEGKLLIIKVSSWKPFQGEVSRELATTGFWPVFSPDAKMIAFEEVDTGSVSNPRLVLFNVKSGKKTVILDLSAYDQESMYVSDWR